MTLVLETGAGVRGANSYVTAAFVSAYLADRGRSEQNDWLGIGGAAQGEACIKATDYVDHRFGHRFKGTREFVLEEVLATATVSFAGGLPNDGDTLTIADEVYTVRTALSSPAVANEVLIGATGDDMARNLDHALRADADNVGVTFSTGTVGSRHVTSAHEVATQETDLTATANGVSGNDTPISSTLTNATVSSAFTGGLDGGSQPLYFPQVGLFDRSGVRVLGIPLKLKQAVAEYAVRAVVQELAPDPTVDDSGAPIRRKSEKVGPIEEEVEYEPGTQLATTLRPYPAADRLLKEYLFPAGQAVR